MTGDAPRISRRIRSIQASASLEASQRARALISQGAPIIDLAAGEPDLPTPPEIVEAACKALRDGHTGYTASPGILELRQAIARHVSKKHGVPRSADHVLVTPGAKQAIYDCMIALVDEGDEVLIPEPSWLSYVDMVKLAGGRPVMVAGPASKAFLPDVDQLEESATDSTRVILINNPVNPTGSVWPDQTLRDIASLAVRRNLVVIADEIYDDLLFDQDSVQSIAGFEGMAERTLQVHGFSKTFSMTGFRLGYVVGPTALLPEIRKVHGQIATCASSVAQHAGIAAMAMDVDSHVAMMRNLYRGRRNCVLEVAGRLDLRTHRPAGALYALLDTSPIDTSSVAAARRIVEEANVACVPGVAYGPSAEGYVRLALTCPEPKLTEAIERIARLR